jgi:hypothetical protein
MPHQAVVLWKSVVQQLQRLPTLNQHQQGATSWTIDKQINVLAHLEGPLPRAVWKQLINDVQVGTVLRPLLLLLAPNAHCNSERLAHCHGCRKA